jgi:hypothetical protein
MKMVMVTKISLESYNALVALGYTVIFVSRKA